MDISVVKSHVDFGNSTKLTQTHSVIQSGDNVTPANTGDVADKLVTAQADKQVHKKPNDLEEVTQMTEAMNKFVQAMEAKIHFIIHEGTNQLMVQVVDQTNNKVLKEFPSSEFLDTMAAIRDYVGILLDKKI